MHYSGTPSYSASSPYTSYLSSSVPHGSSYSASYLGSGSNYSNHSSLGTYTRTPFTQRWLPSSGRTYSPILSTISERGTSSPVRINSPRRMPITKSYIPSGYTSRPININTADIDVSRDKYKSKIKSVKTNVPLRTESIKSVDNTPFMPRVDGKPETGIDSSPGPERSTIKRGRTVVRLHTIKRKERDSPRKPQDELDQNITNEIENPSVNSIEESNTGWRDRLSEDLQYKEKREKKTLGEKLVEKFRLKDNENISVITVNSNLDNKSEIKENSIETKTPNILSRSPDRRCSMELLAEQANLLDSLIRSENLSTATLDLSKVGTTETKENVTNSKESLKKRKENDLGKKIQTTKSDHALHERIKSLSNSKETKQFNKRRSLRKSSSGGSICRLDSITEFSKEPLQFSLPAIEESRFSIKNETVKTKQKLKPKITSSVEISQPTNVLKFKIENVVVEEKAREPRKEISFSTQVEEPISINKKVSFINKTEPVDQDTNHIRNVNITSKDDNENDTENFWDRIGKRETIYLNKRKQNIQEDIIKNRRASFWYPEDEESEKYDDGEQCQSNFKLEEHCDVDNTLNNVSILHNESQSVQNKELYLIGNESHNNNTTLDQIEIFEQPTLRGNKNNEEPATETKKIGFNEIHSDSHESHTNKNITICPKISSVHDKKLKTHVVNNNIKGSLSNCKNNDTFAPNNKIKSNSNKIKYSNPSTINKNLNEEVRFKTEDTEQCSNIDKVKLDDKINQNQHLIQSSGNNDREDLIKTPETLPSNNNEMCTNVLRKGIENNLSNEVNKENKKAQQNDDIPIIVKPNIDVQNVTSSGEGEKNKADIEKSNKSGRDSNSEKTDEKSAVKLPVKRPVKEERAIRPLIATPRPLQKKNPQVIRTSSSSESSSEEESSDDDADESDTSEETEFYECETNPDGRTSTGSNDSGFDSSAPTSPAGIIFIKKGKFQFFKLTHDESEDKYTVKFITCFRALAWLSATNKLF